jgi:hypothetical protein
MIGTGSFLCEKRIEVQMNASETSEGEHSRLLCCKHNDTSPEPNAQLSLDMCTVPSQVLCELYHY